MALRYLWATAATLALATSLAPPARCASYNESSLPDISDVPATPTAWALDPGANVLTGATGGADVDILHITVPSGHVLSALVLNAYQNQFMSFSFVGIGAGSTWPTDTLYDIDPVEIMGWSHFGFYEGAEVGDDLLAPMSLAQFSPGFDRPLAAGDYAVLVQDVDFPVTYAMTFQVTPVPEPAAAAIVAPLAFVLRRRTRNR